MVFDQEIFLLFPYKKAYRSQQGIKHTLPNALCQIKTKIIVYVIYRNKGIGLIVAFRTVRIIHCFPLPFLYGRNYVYHIGFYCIRMVGFCQSIFSLETRLHRRPGQHHPGNADAIEIFPFILVGSGKSTEESVESMQNNSNLCIT